jgi:hypothetical protein
MGRPPIGTAAMTSTERSRRFRAKSLEDWQILVRQLTLYKHLLSEDDARRLKRYLQRLLDSLCG